jgi:hypothetical protein
LARRPTFTIFGCFFSSCYTRKKPSAVAAAAPTDTVINVEQLQLTQQQQLLPTMQELLHGMQEDRKARTKIHFHQVT